MRALALAVHRREAPLHRAHRLHALLLAVGEAVGEAADRDLIQWLDAHLEAYPPHALRARAPGQLLTQQQCQLRR